MASNMHYNGGAMTTKKFTFARAVSHLNIFVAGGITFSISLDGGDKYMGVAAGSNSIPVGPLTTIFVTSTGAFNIVGVQA